MEEIGMNNAQLYKVVRDWLAQTVECSDDDVLGDITVVSMAVCDIDTDIERDIAKYGNADDALEYKSRGATHLARFLTVCEADLVDGDNLYFYIAAGGLIPVSDPDRPALCGDYLDSGYKWVAERATRLATDIGDNEDE
jgi:hypothetical protein